MGFTDGCFRDSDETLARIAFKGVSFDELRAHGWVKLPIPEAPFAEGGFPTANGRCRIDAPDIGIPDYIPNYESHEASPELARDYPLAMISPPARNFVQDGSGATSSTDYVALAKRSPPRSLWIPCTPEIAWSDGLWLRSLQTPRLTETPLVTSSRAVRFTA